MTTDPRPILVACPRCRMMVPECGHPNSCHYGVAVNAEQNGPPFTIERYGNFSVCVLAERDWLRRENEQLRLDLTQHLGNASAVLRLEAQNADLRVRLREAVDLVKLHAYIEHWAWIREVESELSNVTAERKPCGCTTCICEDENQCHGCGARYCAEHDPRRASTRG